MYDYEIVATKNFEYPSFVFTIWDLFDDFDFSISSQILIKVSLYDPLYFMPS